MEYAQSWFYIQHQNLNKICMFSKLHRLSMGGKLTLALTVKTWITKDPPFWWFHNRMGSIFFHNHAQYKHASQKIYSFQNFIFLWIELKYCTNQKEFTLRWCWIHSLSFQWMLWTMQENQLQLIHCGLKWCLKERLKD